MELPSSNKPTTKFYPLAAVLIIAIVLLLGYLASNIKINPASKVPNKQATKSSQNTTNQKAATSSALNSYSSPAAPPTNSAFFGGPVTAIDYAKQTFSVKSAKDNTVYNFVLAKDAVVNKTTGKGDFSAIKVGTGVFVFSKNGAKVTSKSVITADTVSY